MRQSLQEDQSEKYRSMTDDRLTSADRDDQALAWVARLRADSLSEADLEGFADWLAESDQHRSSWDQALLLWDQLEVINALPLDALLAMPAPQPLTFAARLRKRWLPLATAATLLMAVALWMTEYRQADYQSYQTATGDYLEVELEDGSVVELNTDTRLRVYFQGKRRLVKLIQGEAFFVVSPDKQRPFIVDFGEARAEVLGTAFNVYRDAESSARVVVREGVVKVAEQKGAAARVAQSQLLLAGQSVHFSEEKGFSDIETLNPAATIAWREQNLVFDGVTLAAAVTQLNRYLEQKVVLGATVGGGKKVSGIFSLEDKEASIQAVAQAVGLQASREGDRWRLSPAKP